jgi:prepilin-type processing-associated H-X9-DG protein
MVALGVIVLLVALSAAGIQQAREAARRSQCKNNLKQIGLALHNYHDTHDTLPPGWIGPNANGTFMGWGWHAMILPYLDADSLYSRLNFSLPMGPNSGERGTEVQTARHYSRCPSDTGSDLVTVVGTTPANGVFGRSNYVAVYGASDALPVGPQIVPWGVVPTGAGGAFHQNSRHHFSDFDDGLSNAMLVGERCSPATVGRSTLGGDAIWAGVPIAPKQTKPNNAPSGTAADQQYQAYIIGDCHPATPLNYRQITRPSAAVPAPPANPNVTGFGSWHTGGAQFLMGDGAVRFISDKIHPEVYRNLSTIADGHVLCNQTMFKVHHSKSARLSAPESSSHPLASIHFFSTVGEYCRVRGDSAWIQTGEFGSVAGDGMSR